MWIQRCEAGGERARIARELRSQVLDEVDLIDVAARDRIAHALDGGGVVARRPGPPPGAEGKSRRTSSVIVSLSLFDNILLRPDGAGGERQRARLRRRAASAGAGSSTRGRSPGTGRRRGPRRPARRSRARAAIPRAARRRPPPRGSRSCRGRPSRAAAPDSDVAAASACPDHASSIDRHHAAERIGSRHAARHDRPGPDGREHRAPADARRPHLRRLRRQSRCRRGAGRRRGTGANTLEDFVASSTCRAGRGSWSRRGRSPRRRSTLGALLSRGRRDHRRRQLLLPGRHPPRGRARRARDRLPRLRHERRRVRPRSRLLPHGRRPGRRVRGRSSRSSRRSRPAWRRRSARPAATGEPTQEEQGTSTAGRRAPGTS